MVKVDSYRPSRVSSSEMLPSAAERYAMATERFSAFARAFVHILKEGGAIYPTIPDPKTGVVCKREVDIADFPSSVQECIREGSRMVGFSARRVNGNMPNASAPVFYFLPNFAQEVGIEDVHKTGVDVFSKFSRRKIYYELDKTVLEVVKAILQQCHLPRESDKASSLFYEFTKVTGVNDSILPSFSNPLYFANAFLLAALGEANPKLTANLRNPLDKRVPEGIETYGFTRLSLKN